MIKNYVKVLWLGLLWLTVSVQATEEEIAFSEPLKLIMVKKSHPVFHLILRSNPTTGYLWALKSYDANLLTPLNHKFYPSPNKKLMGSPGYEKWTFRVNPHGFIVPQLTSLTLIYLRPWDEQGAQVINFKVVTNNAN